MTTPDNTPSASSGAHSPDTTSLLGLRAALVLTLAVLTGVGAGVLAALAGYHLAEAVLVGGAATAAAAALFNWVIARR